MHFFESDSIEDGAKLRSTNCRMNSRAIAKNTYDLE